MNWDGRKREKKRKNLTSFLTSFVFFGQQHLPAMNRRHFIQQTAAGLLASNLASAQAAGGLIVSIDKVTLKHGRDGSGPSWFHPRPCVVPGKDGPKILMTMQEIRGSDYFLPVHFMESADLGETWTEPKPVPSLGRDPTTDGRGDEGVCDVVPQYHAKTDCVLALGHNVFYRGPKFDRKQPPRCPVYAVYKDGVWSARKRLLWDDPRGAFIYTNNCGQREVLEDGSIAFVMSFGPNEAGRSAVGVRCSFDGETLAIQKVGREIKHAAGRGLLEPSMVRYRGKFYATIRAEDSRGYVAASDDGLDFEEKQPWCWPDPGSRPRPRPNHDHAWRQTWARVTRVCSRPCAPCASPWLRNRGCRPM